MGSYRKVMFGSECKRYSVNLQFAVPISTNNLQFAVPISTNNLQFAVPISTNNPEKLFSFRKWQNAH
jgi:hypothetical protein